MRFIFLLLPCLITQHREIQANFRDFCDRTFSDRAVCLAEIPEVRERRKGDWLVDLSGFSKLKCGDGGGVYYYSSPPKSLGF